MVDREDKNYMTVGITYLNPEPDSHVCVFRDAHNVLSESGQCECGMVRISNGGEQHVFNTALNDWTTAKPEPDVPTVGADVNTPSLAERLRAAISEYALAFNKRAVATAAEYDAADTRADQSYSAIGNLLRELAALEAPRAAEVELSETQLEELYSTAHINHVIVDGVLIDATKEHRISAMRSALTAARGAT